MLGTVAIGATITPNAIAGYVPGSVCTPDNPWLQHREIDSGYSKLDVEIQQRFQQLYMDPFRRYPDAIVAVDKRIIVRFDVPASVAHLYDVGGPLSPDFYPHIKGLYVNRVAINMGNGRIGGEVEGEILDPGEGIDLYAIKSILYKARS